MKSMLFLLATLWVAVPVLAARQTVQQPPAAESRSAPRTLRLIDLRDQLLVDAEIPDFTEPDPGALPSPSGNDDPSVLAAWMEQRVAKLRQLQGGDEGRIAARAEQWQTMLRLWIEPPLSPGLDRLELLANGTLVAQLPAEGHAWLEQFFALQLGERFTFTSEFQILVGPRGGFDSLLPSGSSTPAAQDFSLVLRGHELKSGPDAASGFLRPGANLLTPNDVQRLLAAAKTQGGVDLLNAPRLVLFTRSRGYISTYDKVEYVKDWSLRTVEPGHKTIAVPTIDSVRDGLGVSVRGVELDVNRLGVEVELWRSVLKKPIRTASVRLDVDGGRDFEVALPEVDTQRLRSHLVIEPGRSVYFRGPAPSEDKEMIVVVTVTRSETPGPGKK